MSVCIGRSAERAGIPSRLTPKALAFAALLLFVVMGLPGGPYPPERDLLTPPPEYGSAALAFEPNQGQTDSAVRFLAHSRAGIAYFTTSGVTLKLRGGKGASAKVGDERDVKPVESPGEPADSGAGETIARVTFTGSRPAVSISPGRPLSRNVNYLLGDDPANWITNLQTYASITYDDLYPGIALAYSGSSHSLKGTFNVIAGADPARIRWRYQGPTALRLDAEGNLQITFVKGVSEESGPARDELGGAGVT